MMKLKIILATALFAVSACANAWTLWDEFKAANYDSGRVIDYSDSKLITTSEGQSYGMFFSLVAGDKETFAELFDWTEKNLGVDQPAWLWGIPDGKKGHAGKVMDTNNATDSDMWIAYCLLEAARLWDMPEYKAKADGYLAKLKELVRDVPTIGKVLLPGRVGFEEKGVIRLNPSYYPIFILRRFAEEDPFWQQVLEGSVAAIVRSSPGGAAADWSKFDSTGKLLEPDKMIGSYNAIRTYLWAGMMSPKDPVYGQLAEQFAPMIDLVKITNVPPEEVAIMAMTMGPNGNDSFGACFLPYLAGDKSGDVIRTLLTKPLQGENYYGNCLTVFGLGFDNRSYAFNEKGMLILPDPARVFVSPGLLRASEPAQPADSTEAPKAPETAEPPKAAEAAPAPAAPETPKAPKATETPKPAEAAAAPKPAEETKAPTETKEAEAPKASESTEKQEK